MHKDLLVKFSERQTFITPLSTTTGIMHHVIVCGPKSPSKPYVGGKVFRVPTMKPASSINQKGTLVMKSVPPCLFWLLWLLWSSCAQFRIIPGTTLSNLGPCSQGLGVSIKDCYYQLQLVPIINHKYICEHHKVIVNMN